MKYEIEIRSSKGYRFGVQYIWEKEILVREQLFHHAIESKTHDHFRCKTFIRFTRDLNDNMGAKKILYSPSSSSSPPCIWSETVARQVKSLQARFFIISARKDSAHLTHPQPDSDNSRRSREWACKELLLAKGFWRDLGKTKQNIGQWNIFDLPWSGSVFIVMANITALHILLTVFYSRLRDNGGESRIRAKEIFWQEYAS